jgi:hypothetical protein
MFVTPYMKQSTEARSINLKTSKPYPDRKPSDHNEGHNILQKLLSGFW